MAARELALAAAVCVLIGVSCGQTGRSRIIQPPGGSVQMQCNIVPGGNVIWYKQGSEAKMEVARDGHLSLSDTRYELTSDNGAYIITINPTKESDSGTFMCESSSREGAMYKHTFVLKIGAGGSAARSTAATIGTVAAAAALLLLT